MKLYSILAGVLAAGLAAACSTPPAVTLTDPLDDAAWEVSEWISAADAPVVTERIGQVYRSADGASWFLSTVVNEGKVKKARWMTSGLGVFELYVNGKPVGEEILKPGFTHVEKTRRSFTYDITALLEKGKGKQNVLSAQVTPGWWADKIATPGGHVGMIGQKCAFRGVLELVYADGTTKRYGTDCTSWKAGIAGPVKHAGIFDGEEYDAREKPGFETPEKLGTPEVNTEFPGRILPTDGAEVYLRKDLELKPVRTYVWKDVDGAVAAEKTEDIQYGKVVILREYAAGEPVVLNPGENLVVDFGQNAAAVPSFTFKAAEGTTLACLPGEILNDGNGAESRGMDGPEGSVHRRNLRAPKPDLFRVDYTFGPGDAFVSYYPHCTFFGYRYISVTVSAPVEFRSITSIPVTSIKKDMETGRITTGSDDINKLISNTIWGQRSNYLSVPTDCPQRDERLGWMADTQVFAETGTFFANTRDFFHKWMQDVRDSQLETGAYPGVSPKGQYGGEAFRLGWSDAGVIVPWIVWKQFGDVSIVKESWKSMEKYMAHMNETKYDHMALIEENGHYQWADWLSYEPLESCEGRCYEPGTWNRLPEAIEYWNYLSACYWALDASYMRDMAVAAGYDAVKYETMEKDAKTYLKERFLEDDGSFKLSILNTMQTPALFALKNKLVEGDAKDAMLARLRQNFADHDGCLQTGFLGTSILMQTLTENGMADVAYELLFQHKNPSWLYSVDNGATTIWERWNSYTIEKGMGPRGMNSFNHYAYGCVCQWLWETAAGIAADPSAPGFRHIIMSPVPDRRLSPLTAEYDSAAGLIKSSWQYEGDEWVWTFTVPKGATATVTLPGEDESKDYEAGTYTVRRPMK